MAPPDLLQEHAASDREHRGGDVTGAQILCQKSTFQGELICFIVNMTTSTVMITVTIAVMILRLSMVLQFLPVQVNFAKFIEHQKLSIEYMKQVDIIVFLIND